MSKLPAAPVHVLLVDDDADDAALTQRLLHSAVVGSYVVDWRDGFESGLAALAETAYDVMLLDFRLSGETGLDLLRTARQRGTHSPAILLTGQLDRDLDLKAMEAGVVDFLDKNKLSSAGLERSIRYAAGRGRSEQERVALLDAERLARAEAEEAQVRTTAALESVRFQAHLLDTVEQSVVATDLDGAVTYWNRFAQLMHGWSSAEAVGRNISEVTGANLGSEHSDSIVQKIRDGHGWAGELDLKTRDGWAFPAYLTLSPLRDEIGTVVGMVGLAFDITERRNAEIALQRSEAFFRAAFLGSAVPSMLVDLAGAVIQANRAMSNLLGHETGGLDGASMLAFTSPVHFESTSKALASLIAGEVNSVQHEKRYVHRDGHGVDVLVTKALVRDPDGGPAYFTTQVADISDRKRAERAVLERERHLAKIVAVQQEVVTTTVEGTAVIELITERARALTRADGGGIALLVDNRLVYQTGAGSAKSKVGFGLKLDSSLTGRCLVERAPLRCDDADADPRVHRGLASSLKARSIVCVPLLHHDTPIGVLTMFSGEVKAFTDGDVHTLQLMAGLAAAAIANSMAFAAKQALVVERTGALDALSEKESLIRSLIDNATDPLITLDQNGVITYASPSLERLLGRQAVDFVGVHPLTLCHPDDQSLMADSLFNMVAREERNVALEARLAHRDGSWRVMRVTCRNMLEDPAIRGIIVNMHDMTDEVVVAAQLRQAQKLEAVGQLAGGVAHDFNNLLTVISGHCEFLAESVAGDSVQAADVNEIRLAAARAAALTKQLLAFSRQQMLVPEVTDVNTIVAGVQPMLQRLIGEDITFVTRPSAGPAHILADRGQVEQVLMNLVINGRDAMPHGGTLTIEVQIADLDDSYLGHREVKPGRYVMLAVTDTGMGMDAELREHIFDPFFTTKASGLGTGLGLSTVYGIVKQSGGYIWVYSEPGLWSTFKVYFPLSADDSQPTQPAVIPRAVGGSETILLVEDEVAVRSISRRILVGHGYQVLEARDGVEALEVAAAFPNEIHLLVTDVVMPRMNGRILAEQLTRMMPEMAVLYLSGYTNDDILRRTPAPADARLRLLQKPFTSQALATAVREAIALGAGSHAMASL